MKNVYPEKYQYVGINYLGYTCVADQALILQWIKFWSTKQFWYRYKTKMNH